MVDGFLKRETDFLDREIAKSHDIFPTEDENIDQKIEQLESQAYLLNLSNRSQMER